MTDGLAVDEQPRCDVPVPDGLGWLKPAPVCRHQRGHGGMCDDGLGAHWTGNGSYGIHPSRYFGNQHGMLPPEGGGAG